MIARVKIDNNITYDTVVFVRIKNGWESKIIGFNKTLDKLELINCWSIHPVKRTIKRNVFILEEQKTDWIQKDWFFGYEFIVNNNSLIKRIEQNKKINPEILNKCKEMQANMKIDEWNIIENQDDIHNLMAAAMGFHDSVVENIEVFDDGIEVKFDTKWNCYIIIRFENEVEYRCEEGYGTYGEILGASIFIENSYIYWVDYEIDSSNDIFEEVCYFKSKKVKWKIDIY